MRRAQCHVPEKDPKPLIPIPHPQASELAGFVGKHSGNCACLTQELVRAQGCPCLTLVSPSRLAPGDVTESLTRLPLGRSVLPPSPRSDK